MSKEIKLVITEKALKKINTALTVKALVQSSSPIDSVLHKIMDAMSEEEAEVLIDTKEERDCAD